jgi:hypothetical protein
VLLLDPSVIALLRKALLFQILKNYFFLKTYYGSFMQYYRGNTCNLQNVIWRLVYGTKRMLLDEPRRSYAIACFQCSRLPK